MNDECCKNCLYCHEFRKFKNKYWSVESCCVVLTKFDDDKDEYNSFVLAVNDDDKCEMFTKR